MHNEMSYHIPCDNKIVYDIHMMIVINYHILFIDLVYLGILLNSNNRNFAALHKII